MGPYNMEEEHLASMTSPSSDLSEKKTVLVTPGSDKEATPAAVSTEPVKDPHDNDVLCGRGGSINSHKGNERFRSLVEKRKRVYLTARFKREKRLIANSIVTEIRSLNPPGRFLTRDSKTGLWRDIGDEKARDKTSQALRENAPSIRAEIEVEINHQRAELQREEEEAARAARQAQNPPPHPHYYGQAWGYNGGYYNGYGGQYPPPDQSMPYGHPPPPGQAPTSMVDRSWSHEDAAAPSPVHSHASSATPRRGTPHRGPPHDHYPAPRTMSHDEQSHHSHHSHHSHASSHMSSHVSPSPHHTPSRTNSHAEDDDQMSAFDSLPSFVNAVPSSLAAWTKNSFSFGGHSVASSTDQHDSVSHGTPRRDGRPMSYTPTRDGRGRAVHFAADGRRPHPNHHRQPNECHDQMYMPIQETSSANSFASNSITRDSRKRNYAMQSSEEDHPGLLTQVANHIMGSWDTSSVCGASHDHQHGSPRQQQLMSNSHYSMASSDYHPETSLADNLEPVEEEGQEVELVEMMEYEDQDMGGDNMGQQEGRHDAEARRSMPPPAQKPPANVEIDWTSKFGCQSTWLPESFSNGPPASLFGAKPDEPSLAQSGSLDMDASAMGTENYSVSSIGGASLTHVFTNDSMDRKPPSPIPQERTFQPELDQVPSWDRSFNSSTPLSVCSDSSIVSTQPEKSSKASQPPSTIHSIPSIGSDEMKWDQE